MDFFLPLFATIVTVLFALAVYDFIKELREEE